MKSSLFFATIAIFILTACEKTDPDVFFRIGNNLDYRFSDIELYDSSTHIMYFRNVHHEFEDIERAAFTFLDNGDPIYSGTFWPAYSSATPSGPYILSPLSMFGNYALRIEYWNSDKPDLRNDPQIINLLKQQGLLHSGLEISSGSVEITGTQLMVTFTLTNRDQTDLLIIDPDKTGMNLFHYFTNGIYIYDSEYNQVFFDNIQSQAPDPWNSWQIDWLSELKSGESREFKFTYTLADPLAPGEYSSLFEFPGLSYQVARDELYQGERRIWLGDVTFRKKITIQ
jgi:hypothetical protein